MICLQPTSSYLHVRMFLKSVFRYCKRAQRKQLFLFVWCSPFLRSTAKIKQKKISAKFWTDILLISKTIYKTCSNAMSVQHFDVFCAICSAIIWTRVPIGTPTDNGASTSHLAAGVECFFPSCYLSSSRLPVHQIVQNSPRAWSRSTGTFPFFCWQAPPSILQAC